MMSRVTMILQANGVLGLCSEIPYFLYTGEYCNHVVVPDVCE